MSEGARGPGAGDAGPPDDWSRVAAGWAKWFDTIEAAARPVTERLIALAGLRPGLRVLDLGTGLGEPAATAACRVAPGGSVLATDLAPAMLERARARARRLGLDNLEFRLMDMAALELPEAAFDAALSRWGLMFAAKPEATLAALARLLRPGGRLACAVWGPPEAVPGISLPTRVFAERLALPPLSEDARTPFSLSDVQALQRNLRKAGFRETTCEPLTVTFRFESAASVVAFRRECSTAEARAAHCAPERIAEAWRAVGEAIAPFVDAGGGVTFPNLAYCVSAMR